MLKHRILYLQYTNPAGYPPLEQGSRILANQGWHVLFIGTGAQGANVLEFPPHPGIEVRRLKFCPSGWRQKLHYFYYAFWVFGWVLRWRPQWIYASDPHSCPIALALNFVPGLRIAYHEHDSPASSLHPPPSTFQRLCLWTRRKLAHRAALCILPNERRVELFKEQTGTTQPVLCVWNCPRREEALRAKPEMLKLEMRKREEEGGLKSDIRDQRSQDGGRKSEVGHAAGVSRVTSTLHSAREDGHHASRFIVFYHGSIVPARLPMTVIEALARLPEHVVLRIAGYETGGGWRICEPVAGTGRAIGNCQAF